MTKLVILGNSTGLRVRPPVEHPYNRSFTELLRVEAGYDVINLCSGRALVRDLIDYPDASIREFPDYYVISIGISDACTREIPLWFSNIMKRSRRSLLRNVSHLIYNLCIKKVRKHLVKLRFRTSWTGHLRFEKEINKLIKDLTKNTNARLIFIGILTPSDRVERELPGSRDSVTKFNNILKKIVSQKNRCYLIEVDDLNSADHYPDGIHWNSAGHLMMFNKINDHIS